jgi:hypothetical protein
MSWRRGLFRVWVVLVLLWSAPSLAKTGQIWGFQLDGVEWQKLHHLVKVNYIIGAWDGYAHTTINHQTSNDKKIMQCALERKYTGDELVTITDNYYSRTHNLEHAPFFALYIELLKVCGVGG